MRSRDFMRLRTGLIAKKLLCPLLFALCFLVPGAAHADVVFAASGTGNSGAGPLGATIDFKALNGGLEVTVTNTLPSTDTINKGEAISAFSFGVSGLSKPTAFYELSGNLVDSTGFTPGTTFPGSSPVTPFNDTSNTNIIDHWSLSTTGSDILATAGNTAPGKNPMYMILPSSGITGPGSSLADGHFDPYILGSANFFLTVPGLTANTVLNASDFTGVTVGFGTSPDTTLSAQVVPEPASLTLLGIGSVAVGGFGFYRRRTKAAASNLVSSTTC
jgi:hypothetical protein